MIGLGAMLLGDKCRFRSLFSLFFFFYYFEELPHETIGSPGRLTDVQGLYTRKTTWDDNHCVDD